MDAELEAQEPDCICADPKEPHADCYFHGVEGVASDDIDGEAPND